MKVHGFLLLIFLVFAGTGAGQQKKPNVLFLFTDDQRSDTIHALGNAAIRTPTLDRLAESGFVFRNAYCMGGDVPAIGKPSRYMLLSGLSLFHRNRVSPKLPNFPRSMREAGYLTYHHGKKGNTCPVIQKDFEIERYLTNDQKEREGGYPGKEVADAAVSFLREYKKERPFFMYLAFGNPHDPRVVNKEYRDRYEDEKMPLPKNYLPIHPFDNGDMAGRDESLAPWPRTPEVVRKHLADYYGVITYLDMEMGRVLRALEDIGEYENTIIVFSSDHGLAIGSHGLFGKQSVYEDAMKPPLIFSGPGIPKGRSDAFAYLFDIYPTVCELAGVPLPTGLDGKSLSPVIQGRTEKVRDAIMLAYRSFQRSAREGDWKLLRYPQINRSQIFNLSEDPAEANDLAGDPKVARKLEEMMELLGRLQKEFDDDLPLSSSQPRSERFVPPK